MDAAHCWNGMLYRFYGKDANRASVPFLDLWSIDNESNGSWEYTTTTLVDIYGEYVDNDDTIFIGDAQKGLGAALKKVMMNSATFICEGALEKNRKFKKSSSLAAATGEM